MVYNDMKNISSFIRNNVRALFNFSWKIGGNSAYRVFEGALTLLLWEGFCGNLDNEKNCCIKGVSVQQLFLQRTQLLII